MADQRVIQSFPHAPTNRTTHDKPHCTAIRDDRHIVHMPMIDRFNTPGIILHVGYCVYYAYDCSKIKKYQESLDFFSCAHQHFLLCEMRQDGEKVKSPWSNNGTKNSWKTQGGSIDKLPDVMDFGVSRNVVYTL
ncbi:hypothetical protein TNCV_2855861 [Trichonephila clavipes]|nr:hypothetical protein TNCV_2855861 [Trichonephila clavipes]